jgi:hypothetical protein
MNIKTNMNITKTAEQYIRKTLSNAKGKRAKRFNDNIETDVKYAIVFYNIIEIVNVVVVEETDSFAGILTDPIKRHPKGGWIGEAPMPRIPILIHGFYSTTAQAMKQLDKLLNSMTYSQYTVPSAIKYGIRLDDEKLEKYKQETIERFEHYIACNEDERYIKTVKEIIKEIQNIKNPEGIEWIY